MALQQQIVVAIDADQGFADWLEKKSRYIRAWRQRWIVLDTNARALISYTDQDKSTQTEYMELKDYSSVCKAGNLIFKLYKQSKPMFAFRAKTYDDCQLWIKYISNAITLNGLENIGSLTLFKEPAQQYIDKKVIKGVQKLGVSGYYTEKKQIFIHTNLRARKNEILKAKFAHQRGEKHPELLIYGDEPEYDDDRVIRIDLVCIHDDKMQKKMNKVRLQSKTWGDFKNRDCDDREYPIIKTLDEITEFCIQYQQENEKYSVSANNCRKFMIELCVFLNIKYPNAYPGEDKWYGLMTVSGSGWRDDVEIKNQEQSNMDEKNNEETTDKSSLSIFEQKKEQESGGPDAEITSEDDLFQYLYNQSILTQYSGNYFNENIYYKILKDTVWCFVMGNRKIDDFKYEFLILLIKKHVLNTENNRYFQYKFNISYEQMKVIDDTLNKMGDILFKKEKEIQLNGNKLGNVEMNKAKIQNASIEKWIMNAVKPPLLHPDECKDCLRYYSMYLQVLFSHNELDYICYALQIPNKLYVLMVKLAAKCKSPFCHEDVQFLPNQYWFLEELWQH